ncbi:MAG: hypothetical protein DRJ03_01700 [Chloroflexi bacterium]|nr:MAG: hypothetical protein DRJ03_01700 [Chloroflexota bacterium]
MWKYGDGCGGYVLTEIAEAAMDAGLPIHPPFKWPFRGQKHLARMVFERDKYRCQYCGTWKNLTVDHIVPVSKGGSDDVNNLQTLCNECNARKGARLE